MTNALCVGSAREQSAWAHVVDLAMRRQVPLVPVVLVAAEEEILRRVQSPGRQGRKVSDPEEVRGYFAADRLQHPAMPELLVLDVTRLSADEAATEIGARVEKLRAPGVTPASERHLRMT